MTNEELLTQMVEQQNRYINMLSVHLDRAERLLEQSENRIDRTNTMVEKLAECAKKHEELTNKITQEYCKHLDTITTNRDEIIRQNTMLLELVKEIRSGIQFNQRFND